MTRGTLIILSSPNGETDWTPVKPADVPAWIKDDPDVLGRLVENGEACCDNDQTPAVWYMAQRILTEAEQNTLRSAIKMPRKKLLKLAVDQTVH